MLHKLARNTVVALTGTTLQKVLGFVTTLVLARGLGEDAFGIYSFVGVYMFFFGFFVDLGMERVVTRELARAPARLGRVLGNAILLKLALCAIAVPAAYAVARFMEVPAEAQYCILIAAIGLPLSVELLFRSYFQSQYEVHISYAVTLPSGASFLLLAALCVYWRLPLHAIFYAALVNGAMMLALLMFITMSRIRPILRPERKLLLMLLRDAGEVGMFVLLFMLVMRIDQILLFSLRGAAEVGRYAVAVKVTEALSILPEGLMLTVFPILAASHNSAPDRFRHTYRLSFKYLSAVILPVALVLTLARHEFVDIVFGPQYADSALPLAILAWGMFFAYTGAVYLNLFIVQHQQRLLLVVSVLTLIINVGANLLLIPLYGASGAALATVIANVVGFACWVFLPATAPFMKACMAEAVRPTLAVAIAWVAVTLLSASGLFAVVLALVLYAIVMVASGGFSWSDVDLVRQLFATEPA